MEQLIMIDAAKRASAKSNHCGPFPTTATRDRIEKSAGREPITAKLIADMLQAAGAQSSAFQLTSTRVRSRDSSNIPVDHLVAAPVFEEYLITHAENPHDLVVVAPDAGRVKVAERYASIWVRPRVGP